MWRCLELDSVFMCSAEKNCLSRASNWHRLLSCCRRGLRIAQEEFHVLRSPHRIAETRVLFVASNLTCFQALSSRAAHGREVRLSVCEEIWKERQCSWHRQGPQRRRDGGTGVHLRGQIGRVLRSATKYCADRSVDSARRKHCSCRSGITQLPTVCTTRAPRDVFRFPKVTFA